MLPVVLCRKRYEKRSLGGCETKVISLWKCTAAKQAANLDIDSIVANERLYICRKCLYAYEKLLKTQAVIEDNITKALQCIVGTDGNLVPVPEAPAAKRYCLADPPTTCIREQPAATGSAVSPDVAVSIIITNIHTKSNLFLYRF